LLFQAQNRLSLNPSVSCGLIASRRQTLLLTSILKSARTKKIRSRIQE
jgi:hypothetical protein